MSERDLKTKNCRGETPTPCPLPAPGFFSTNYKPVNCFYCGKRLGTGLALKIWCKRHKHVVFQCKQESSEIRTPSRNETERQIVSYLCRERDASRQGS